MNFTLLKPAGKQTRSRVRHDNTGLRKHKPDFVLLVVALILLVIGLVVVYSISAGLAAIKGVGEGYYVTKQLIAVGLGLSALAVCSLTPIVWWRRLVWPLIFASVVAVIAVAIFGKEVYGATRWIQVAGFSFQAAELIKFTLLITVADFLARRRSSGTMKDDKKTLYVVVALIAVLGVVVAGLQSDLGSTAVMIAMIGMMCILAGLPLKKMFIVAGLMFLGLFIAIAPVAYRRQRVATFFHPTADCQNAGYQTCQALIAVGSGGILGKGLGNSVQAYGYLPEAANDSIFAIFGEKFGFFGSALLVMLYMVLFTRIKRVIDHSSDDYMRFIAVGFLAWLSTQTIINIGAMIGLLPLKGITLPFISYGGTSVLFVMAGLGVVLSVSKHTSAVVVPIQEMQKGDNHEASTLGRRRVRRTHYS